MSKQYGLIIPGQQKKPFTRDVGQKFTKPSIFDESSSESDQNGPPQMQMKKAPIGPSLTERRKAKNLQEKALAEDPTIFQYDELYDEMENKREEEKQLKNKEPKKARYITKLIEAAERRKLENELRVERQVQKEREAEGEKFKDKEAFVTSSYRKRLEEMRKLEEKNKRDDYLEAIGDVTKQKDLDGFYRHIYEQKMGTSKDVNKPEIPNTGNSGEDCISYKPIRSEKLQKPRSYRKRKSSDDEQEKDKSMQEVQNKKVHLTNNIDADSDFSIDDTSTESEAEGECKKQDTRQSQTVKDTKRIPAKPEDSAKMSKTLSNSIALNLDSLKPEGQTENKSDNSDKKNKKLLHPLVKIVAESPPQQKPKRDKSEIWRKRTVGDVFIAAVQRYYERKAARNQA